MLTQLCFLRFFQFNPFFPLSLPRPKFSKNKKRLLSSVADPHRKNADADPGKNLNADADPDADHALTELWLSSNSIRNLKRDSPARFYFVFYIYG
jgi:hypothetical protein